MPASARKSTQTNRKTTRPVKQKIKLTEYDPKGGVLREICRDLFERAYGLNGKAKEEHRDLFDEAYAKTHCSVKAFQDLLYGHTYHKECAELRTMVPGYKEKPPPRPDVQKASVTPQTTPRWKAGCLERQAVELFEKAYGLNGRKPEDYCKMLQETVEATGCSQRAFEELVFGHSYSEKLETLRTKVEGYMTKTQWKLFCKDMARSGQTSVVAHLNTSEGRDFLRRAQSIEQDHAARLCTPDHGRDNQHRTENRLPQPSFEEETHDSVFAPGEGEGDVELKVATATATATATANATTETGATEDDNDVSSTEIPIGAGTAVSSGAGGAEVSKKEGSNNFNVNRKSKSKSPMKWKPKPAASVFDDMHTPNAGLEKSPSQSKSVGSKSKSKAKTNKATPSKRNNVQKNLFLAA